MNKEEAYEELRVRIVTNGVAPGEILKEKDLMAQLAIGRSPLREILFRLQEENLIKPLPRLGYMVTTLDISDVRELVELRRELEGFAGYLAAQRITPEQLENLRTIIREAETETVEMQDVSNITEYFDTRFHSLLYQATGNQKLVQVLQDLHIVMLRIWFHVGFGAIGFAHQAQNFYNVLEALELKEPENARTAMEDHVDIYAAQIKEKIPLKDIGAEAMLSGYKSQCVPTYHLLTPQQIKSIHTATLELLETVGVDVHHDEARQMLADAGCRLKEDYRVRIPNWLVEAAIQSAPSRISIYDRLGNVVMRLEGRRVHYGLGTDLIKTYDLDTGELRQSRLKDVAAAARIGDALQHIDFIGSYALAADSPTNLKYLDSFKTELENSIKPIFYTAAGLEDITYINAMAAAAVGGEAALQEKPIHIHYAEPMSPLVHSFGAVQKLFFCADHNIPVNYTPGMMSGASAPVTLAGAITVGNAEALSGLVMHQLRAKGAPIISGFGMSTMDMRTSTCIYGCPEYRLALSACADLYHYYDLPMWGTAGVSDANCLDQQAGMEWAVSIMMDAMHGANLVHDIGYLGQGLIGHPGGLVMCDEIISYVKRFVRGFDLDDAHIGLDVIQEVGPGGEFISTGQTMEMYKTEHWLPDQCNRDNLDNWLMKGRKDWAELSTAKAREILKSHAPEPLSDTAAATLTEIRREAETKLKDHHFRS